MVTYGGMSKKPITVATTSFIFKVTPLDFCFCRVYRSQKLAGNTTCFTMHCRACIRTQHCFVDKIKLWYLVLLLCFNSPG